MDVLAKRKPAALVARACYLPVPLSGEDHVELLPATWLAANAYGVKISHHWHYPFLATRIKLYELANAAFGPCHR